MAQWIETMPVRTKVALAVGITVILIATAGLAVVCLGYDERALTEDRGPLNGFGFLVPRSENVRILGALWETSIYPNRAPAGKALMKVVVHFVPYRVRGDATGRVDGAARGWDWRSIKDAYADYIIDWLSETSLPGLRERIVKMV